MLADTMLAWMSETGSGDIRDLRQRITWLARTANFNPGKAASGRWLRDVSALGHAEVDWEGGRWAIAPAVATLIPAGDGTVVLAGRRPLDFVDQLGTEFAVSVAEPATNDPVWLPAPSTVYIQTESLAELGASLNAVGVSYVGCVARGIAERLPQVQLGEPAGPPAWDTPVEHLAAGSVGGVSFVRGTPDGDGLCRFLVNGRQQYRYRVGSQWLRTDHAPGIWWALAERHEQVIRWRRERRSNSADIGTMFIDQGAPLPPLQARALVLCSGLPTQFGNTARTAIYTNVPLPVADLAARSVRQLVSVID
ncbi:hypothetical protein [Amycolatopsis sp. WQ 127309]|uniref:hypothetical protein n=1 Tax=Amycolatopsis sp. WQ 127309 TaxID=2932773 RepID=UPI001FF6B99A|nr:hypothetical protein [Amycolatopsis sp. WQ 127309]UOZ05581.1 hypothetical protein MUY22_43270 [Amycolatopsis sp. WQ 127309]